MRWVEIPRYYNTSSIISAAVLCVRTSRGVGGGGVLLHLK